MTSIWELPNVYFQNLLLINNTPDNNLQPQMDIYPLPCTPFEQKFAESAYFQKTDSKLTQMTSIWGLPNVFFQNLLLINNTPDNKPSTKNAYLSTPMHTLWAKTDWVSIFLKNRFQIDANYLNLRVAKCIFSKCTPRQQYSGEQPSTSNAYLSTPMHTLWAKICWVSIFFVKNWFQIDANDLNLRVAKSIFSKSTPHQQCTRKQPSTSNAYLSTPMHTLWAKIGWVSIFLKSRFQIDANDLNLRVAKCIFSKSTPHQQYTRQQPAISNAYLSTPMHTLWAKIGWVRLFCKNRF